MRCSRLTTQPVWMLSLWLVCLSSGCSSINIFGHIDAIPANRVPRELLGRPRSEMQEISLSRLRQNPPENYQLGPNDILGIYIESILGEAEGAPPVHFPEAGEEAPSIGFPIPIREDGTIALPLVPPVDVDGLTLTQATEAIRRAYTVDQRLLPEGKDRIIVTMIRRRTYRVLVVREEEGGTEGVTKRGAGFTVDLPAYENDLLHALNETGGLPGLDAKAEVLIIRGVGLDGAAYDEVAAMIRACRQPCSAPPTVPDPPNVTRIPLRFFPEDLPRFVEQDIILNTGDIVLIESRDREKFYTGGVLGGGEFPIPRDYDLDILGAIAIAGGPVGSSGNVLSASGLGNGRGGGGGGRSGGSGPLPPSEAIIVRRLSDGSQIPIKIDLNLALQDSSQRILIQPEDTVLVRYTCAEDTINTFLSLIQFNFLYGLGSRGR